MCLAQASEGRCGFLVCLDIMHASHRFKGELELTLTLVATKGKCLTESPSGWPMCVCHRFQLSDMLGIAGRAGTEISWNIGAEVSCWGAMKWRGT